MLVHHDYAFEILRPLQTAAEARGDEVCWFLHTAQLPQAFPEATRVLQSVSDVERYDPTAVFVPGNWVPQFFPGVKVQLFHGLANDATGKKGHYRIRGLFDLYCTHAREGTRQFQELATQHGHFHVKQTGWPKLDPLFQGTSGSSSAETPVLLYASTFSPSLTSSPHLVETIEQLSKSGNWKVLVTLHPKTDPQVVQRYRGLHGPNFEFHESGEGVLELLKRADVMLCDTSSILLEFMLLGKPVVTFRTKIPGPHVLDVGQESEVEPALQQALTRPEALMTAASDYVSKLHEYSDGRSSERVLSAVDEFIDSVAGTLGPKPLNLWRKFQIRKQMGYWQI